MKNRVVFIIPYFGKIPDYFALWLKSAEMNPDFDFLVYSDLPFELPSDSNVSQKFITFEKLKEKIKEKLQSEICLQTPYKLCDYKPMYGFVFEEDISGYDFWGFMDVDLILGRISEFITDDLLDKYDKLFYEGHFSLFRNCDKMNRLFLKVYPHVLNWKYMVKTRYSCHFDENGTVAWAHEVDPDCGVRFYNSYNFFDVPYDNYELRYADSEGYMIWEHGILNYYSFDNTKKCEFMYIHLQKRDMKGIVSEESPKFAITRNEFYDLEKNSNSDSYKKKSGNVRKIEKFNKNVSARRRRDKLKNLWRGALKFRFCMFLYGWKNR